MLLQKVHSLNDDVCIFISIGSFILYNLYTYRNNKSMGSVWRETLCGALYKCKSYYNDGLPACNVTAALNMPHGEFLETITSPLYTFTFSR